MEKTVFKFSLAAIILGLSSLFIFAEEFNPVIVESIDKPQEKVKIIGKVNKIVNKEQVTFLEVEGKKVEKVEVVIFNDEEIFIKEGDIIEVNGIVEIYKGKKEIIADKIKLK